MSNVNVVMNGNEKIILDAIKNRPEDIKALSDFDLSALIKESLDSGKRDLLFDLYKEYNERDNKKKAETLEEDIEKNEEEQKKINEGKEQENKSREEKIANLKELLKDDTEASSILDEIITDLDTKNKENTEMLEELKKARNTGDSEKVEIYRKAIVKLVQERKALKDKYAGEIPKPDFKNEIDRLKTKWIDGALVGKLHKDGQTILTGPQLKLRSNLRARYTINKTVKAMNKIGDDPKKGVNYIISKATFFQGGKMESVMKRINNFFTIRDTKKLDEVFEEHKKMFIEDLETKMKKTSMSNEDEKTMKAIKARADYYIKAYKRQFITV